MTLKRAYIKRNEWNENHKVKMRRTSTDILHCRLGTKSWKTTERTLPMNTCASVHRTIFAAASAIEAIA